jgi:hypothetical protein
MKITKLRSLIVAAAIGTLGVTSSARADVLGLELAGSYAEVSSDNWTLGYEFSLASSAQVTGLGFWDRGDGYNATTVGLWTASGTLLGAVNTGTSTVTSFATGSTGTWNFMDFSMTLGAGNYVVGSWGDGMEYTFQLQAGTITTNILTFESTREISGGLFQYPTVELCTGCEGFFGGNIRFAADVNSVPEPGTLPLLGAALAGLISVRRRRLA